MVRANFEMEVVPPPLPQQASHAQGLWVKAGLSVGLLCVLILGVRTEMHASAVDDLEVKLTSRFRAVEQTQQDFQHAMDKVQDSKALLQRAVQAETREAAVREELDRVYAKMQGKEYIPPSTTTTTSVTEPQEDFEKDFRPDEPSPMDYKSCNEAEHKELCRLAKAPGDQLEQKSRGCARPSLSYFLRIKKTKFSSCLREAIPILSENCALCFADTADYGVLNCKIACASPGKSCEECMEGHGEAVSFSGADQTCFS